MTNSKHDKPTRVLLVEDEPDDVWLIRRGLEPHRARWDLHVVGGTDEAIDLLARDIQEPPDVLLTALLMRDRSGHDLIAWVRAQPRFEDLPIVVLSDTLNPRDRELAMKLGANKFLEKTHRVVEIFERIREFLNKPL